MAQTRYGGAKWLREMQEQVGEWSTENFGAEQPAEYPLIGAGEEMGELTTSILKHAQGIDDSEKYGDRIGPEAERDAVGDIVIYLLDTMYRAEDDISVADGLARIDAGTESYDHISDPVDGIRVLYMEFGRLANDRMYLTGDDDTLDMVEYDVGAVVAALRQLCDVQGYDFEDCVVDAWEEVSGREWDASISD